MRTHLRGTGRSKGVQLGRVWALGLLVLGSGCATTAPVVSAGSGVPGQEPAAAAAPASAPSSAGGATAKAVTPFARGEAEPALRDGHTGQPLTHTALTERLSREGEVGAELLAATLNAYFGQIIDRIDACGGEVVTPPPDPSPPAPVEAPAPEPVATPAPATRRTAREIHTDRTCRATGSRQIGRAHV